MIVVKYNGRLANNLFQYSLGRILAEALSYSLDVPEIPEFQVTRRAIRGAENTSPLECYTGQAIDLDAILADTSPRKIVLDGYFQKHWLYTPHRETIKKWFTFPPELAETRSTDDLVVNVRRADYVQLGWALPFEYYEEAIEHALGNCKRICIVTDDKNDPFFNRFRKWKPWFFNGPPISQMYFMSRAQSLVLSQSSFSWWSTFLAADEQNVVCPRPSFGIWGPAEPAEAVDLIEEERFHCIDCALPYVPKNAEALYQRYRLRKRWAILKANGLLRRSGVTRAFGWKLSEPNQ